MTWLHYLAFSFTIRLHFLIFGFMFSGFSPVFGSMNAPIFNKSYMQSFYFHTSLYLCTLKNQDLLPNSNPFMGIAYFQWALSVKTVLKIE
jgi:hypothetical protein